MTNIDAVPSLHGHKPCFSSIIFEPGHLLTGAGHLPRKRPSVPHRNYSSAFRPLHDIKPHRFRSWKRTFATFPADRDRLHVLYAAEASDRVGLKAGPIWRLNVTAVAATISMLKRWIRLGRVRGANKLKFRRDWPARMAPTSAFSYLKTVARKHAISDGRDHGEGNANQNGATRSGPAIGRGTDPPIAP